LWCHLLSPILDRVLNQSCPPLNLCDHLYSLCPCTYRPSDRRLSAKLVPTSADRGCHVVSLTDPYCRILGFLDQTCCVNPIDNTHYAPMTTTPSTRTKHFTRTLVRSNSLETHTKYFTSTLTQSTLLLRSHEFFTRKLAQYTSLQHSHELLHYNSHTKCFT
jgi:hypothetical protein